MDRLGDTLVNRQIDIQKDGQIKRWIGQKAHRYTEIWIDRKTDWSTEAQIYRKMDRLGDTLINRRVDIQRDGQIEIQIAQQAHRYTEGWIDSEIDWPKDAQIYRKWIDGQMEGQIGRLFHYRRQQQRCYEPFKDLRSLNNVSE